MARIQGLSAKEAVPAGLRASFAEQESRFGSLMNTSPVYALRPSIYNGVQNLAKGINDSGLIEPELRYLVCLKVAIVNGCPF